MALFESDEPKLPKTAEERGEEYRRDRIIGGTLIFIILVCLIWVLHSSDNGDVRDAIPFVFWIGAAMQAAYWALTKKRRA